MKTKIDSKTKKENPKPAIKIGEQWFSVIGAAQKYLESVNFTNIYEIEFDENKNVKFIGNTIDVPKDDSQKFKVIVNDNLETFEAQVNQFMREHKVFATQTTYNGAFIAFLYYN